MVQNRIGGIVDDDDDEEVDFSDVIQTIRDRNLKAMTDVGSSTGSGNGQMSKRVRKRRRFLANKKQG